MSTRSATIADTTAPLTHSDAAATQLVRAYREQVRPLLEQHKVSTVAASDQAAELIERLLARKRDLRIGVLGEAQVGKSSLINALLGMRALPAGGIGPLTAQATRIDYAESGSITVSYHKGDQLNRVALAVGRYLLRRGELAAADAALETEDQPDELEVAVEAEVFENDEADVPGETGRPRTSRVAEHMLSQLATMLVEDKDVEVERPVLLDGLRAVIEQAPLGDPAAIEPLRGRIAALRDKLGRTERIEEAALAEGRRAFRQELKLRAAGWLSPLVKELELRLDVPLLKEARIVDLPGVGVLGDPSASVAERFVTTEGDALILVTRNSGITESLGSVLEQAGVLTKLLFHGSDAVEPIHLTVAVTFIDNVARERYAALAAEAEELDEEPPDRHEVFREAADEMTRWFRQHLRDELLKSDAFSGLSEERQATRRRAVNRLCETMDVVAVSAPDFMNLQSERTLDMAFLKQPEATGIPAVAEALRGLSRRAQQARDDDIAKARAALQSTIEEQLGAVAGAYERGGGLSEDEWRRFRGDLEGFAVDLTRQMAVFQGEALATLRQVMPKTISLICAEAAATANRRLDRLTRRARELYWPSLNAALARSGKWDKQKLDFPGDLTRALVDGVAGDWEPQVVEAVREEIKRLAERNAKLVEKLCERASRHDARIASDAHVRSQQRILTQQSATCIDWTQERLDRLRTDIQTGLGEVVLAPIAAACKQAIAGKKNRGTGAKDRIIETFREGSQRALDKARHAAEGLLMRHYDQLVVELDEAYLSKHQNPVQAALEALTSEELERARKADAARKQAMLAQIAAVKKAVADTATAA